MLGREILLSAEVKYLSVVLDNKLKLKRKHQGMNTLYQYRNSIGKSWPIRWRYLAIVRPVITYSCAVWWSALNKNF